MKNRGRIAGTLFVVAMFFLITETAYASGTPVISDDGFVKAYFNLYKSYISADNDKLNNTKAELLDVVDYYLSESEISSHLNRIGPRSNKMIGVILADNGVDFDCGPCNESVRGDRCCIYRTGLVPTVYECVGSEVVDVTGYTWTIPVVDGKPMICTWGCCRDKCCSSPDRTTTTITPSTTTTTNPSGGDNCIDDGDCYSRYGPCWVCPAAGKNCTKKVICVTAQDCKDRYSPNINWTCDANGCCIPPATTTTTSSSSSTTSTSLPGDNCQNDISCYIKYGACYICPSIGGNCSNTTMMCDDAQDCKDRYLSNESWTCDSNKCCIPPATTTTTSSSSSTTIETTTSTTTSTTTTTQNQTCYDGTPVGECSSSFTSLCCVYDASQSQPPILPDRPVLHRNRRPMRINSDANPHSHSDSHPHSHSDSHPHSHPNIHPPI